MKVPSHTLSLFSIKVSFTTLFCQNSEARRPLSYNEHSRSMLAWPSHTELLEGCAWRSEHLDLSIVQHTIPFLRICYVLIIFLTLEESQLKRTQKHKSPLKISYAFSVGNSIHCLVVCDNIKAINENFMYGNLRKFF